MYKTYTVANTSTRYTASIIAEYFISKSTPGTNQSITNLKLQKLLYFAQGFYYATKNKRLFEEKIYLTDHGPIVQSVYDKYKGFNFIEIKKVSNHKFTSINENDKKFLDKIWGIFKNFNGKQLEQLMKQDGLLLNVRNSENRKNEIEIDRINHLIRNNYLKQNHTRQFVTN